LVTGLVAGRYRWRGTGGVAGSTPKSPARALAGFRPGLAGAQRPGELPVGRKQSLATPRPGRMWV